MPVRFWAELKLTPPEVLLSIILWKEVVLLPLIVCAAPPLKFTKPACALKVPLFTQLPETPRLSFVAAVCTLLPASKIRLWKVSVVEQVKVWALEPSKVKVPFRSVNDPVIVPFPARLMLKLLAEASSVTPVTFRLPLISTFP